MVVTDSGLQYKIIKEGDGPSPAATDTVTVNYKGTLIDGKEFDSGNGISFPLNGVIKGWTEGLQLMKAGGSTRFFIPSDLAYGPSGPPNIGPNSTLIFDVDLLSIKGKEQPPRIRPPRRLRLIRPPSRSSPATSSRFPPPRK